jgi:hypothetical protein
MKFYGGVFRGVVNSIGLVSAGAIDRWPIEISPCGQRRWTWGGCRGGLRGSGFVMFGAAAKFFDRQNVA